jgi:hypothetical protein
MSFEAAWGFDPEKVLRAQQLFQQVSDATNPDAINDRETGEVELVVIDPRDVRIPRGAASQIYELKRMFRI